MKKKKKKEREKRKKILSKRIVVTTESREEVQTFPPMAASMLNLQDSESQIDVKYHRYSGISLEH